MQGEGRPRTSASEILRLAVPAFGALVAQPLFTLIDAAIVGTLGTTALAGLGAGAQVFTTVTGLAIFLAYGTTAVVARRVGAGQLARGITDGVEGVALGVGLGTVATVVTWLTAPQLVAWIGTSPASTPEALAYLRTVSLAFPFALAAMAAIGVLRGLQDTATTLWITLVAVTANLVLSAWLVLVAGWGVAGSAWGTVAAEALAAALFLAVLVRRAHHHGAALRTTRAGVLVAARGAVPLFWRTVALRAVFVLAIVVAARLGDAELAAYYVTFTVWYLLALGMDALAIAGQALLGRHLGAGSVATARAVTWQMTRWGIALGAILLVVVLAARPWLPGLFGEDPAVQAMVAAALVVVALQQPLAGVVFVLDGVLLGAGDATYLVLAQALALAVFAPAAWWVWRTDGTVTDLWLALTLFMLVRAAAFSARVRGDAWLVTGATR
ncbi:MAG: MATE family efflux transporter [Candidatus Nanopelagicales bacterium]|jgi:putative MATE family efflux protein|nr:MATE family efflux transporter [Candidatus Nanopelagicales bacterium]